MTFNLAPLLCVRDVEASSRWYQHLLDLKSGHGGQEYERLERDGMVVLHLHRWDVGHHHGPFGNPDARPYGNGVVLWVEIEDFDAVATRAEDLRSVVRPRSAGGNSNFEIWVRDPEGYLIVLESPHGSAQALHN